MTIRRGVLIGRVLGTGLGPRRQPGHVSQDAFDTYEGWTSDLIRPTAGAGRDSAHGLKRARCSVPGAFPPLQLLSCTTGLSRSCPWPPLRSLRRSTMRVVRGSPQFVPTAVALGLALGLFQGLAWLCPSTR